MSKSGIYCIENKVNGHKYIGLSSDLAHRKMVHFSRLKCGTHENRYLQFAYNQYGKEAFEFYIIEECSEELLNEREQYWINYYDTLKNGYNLNVGGGSNRGYKHTPEEIAKMQQIQKPKAVYQCDYNKNIIAEYPSASTAAKRNGICPGSIKAVCNRVRHQKSILGYIWVYKEEYDNGIVDWDYYFNNHRQKPISLLQFDLNMRFIREWPSLTEALQYYSNAERAIDSKTSTAKNTVWRTKEFYTLEKYKEDCEFYKNFIPRYWIVTPVRQMTLEGKEIARFNSVQNASDSTGVSVSGIRAAAKGIYKQSGGYKWEYINKQ